MKALVLAGGSGTRLRPISHYMPKQLLPVANRPVLEHTLASIAAIGVTEVGIVVGEWHTRIAETIGDGTKLGLGITYLRQPAPLGLADCVRLARPFLADDDFVMYLGDNFLPDGIAAHAARFRVDRPTAQLVVHRVTDPRAFGVAVVDRKGAVRHLVEKPERPPSDLALVGVYFFGPSIHAAVSAIGPSRRGELEITDAVQWLVAGGADVRATEHRGYWRDTGCIEDVLDANRYQLRQLAPRNAGSVDSASDVGRQVVIEPGAEVVRSRIVGPAVVGAGALVADSYLGPYTAVGDGCVVRSSRLEDTVVVAGAGPLLRSTHTGQLIGP